MRFDFDNSHSLARAFIYIKDKKCFERKTQKKNKHDERNKKEGEEKTAKERRARTARHQQYENVKWTNERLFNQIILMPFNIKLKSRAACKIRWRLCARCARFVSVPMICWHSNEGLTEREREEEARGERTDGTFQLIHRPFEKGILCIRPSTGCCVDCSQLQPQLLHCNYFITCFYNFTEKK